MQWPFWTRCKIERLVIFPLQRRVGELVSDFKQVAVSTAKCIETVNRANSTNDQPVRPPSTQQIPGVCDTLSDMNETIKGATSSREQSVKNRLVNIEKALERLNSQSFVSQSTHTHTLLSKATIAGSTERDFKVKNLVASGNILLQTEPSTDISIQTEARLQVKGVGESPVARFIDSTGTDQLRLTAQGNVIVGPMSQNNASATDAKFYVDGKAFAVDVVARSIAQLSSQELRKDISDLSSEEAEVLLGQLEPVTFTDRADENGAVHTGFIAETVPEVVTTADRQAVHPLNIVAILTKVTKDHQMTLDRMIDVLEQQQAEIRALNAQLAKLS